MLRKLALVFLLEIVVGINAGLSFRFLERFPAALWAGTCFAVLGLFILTYIGHWNFKSRSPLFWMAMIHTFVFSLPMLITRIVTPANESVTQVLWVPMEHAHKASTFSYALMFGATLLQMALEILKMRKKNPKF